MHAEAGASGECHQGIETELADTAAQQIDARNLLMFSAASLWEVAIKSGLGRGDFRADARLLRRGLLDNGYDELVPAST